MSTKLQASQKETRFEFGKNWKHFLEILSDERIEIAEASLKEMLEVENLNGIRFLDIGSGSGLFSLAARNLGASVVSFDYDKHSVACTQELKRRYWLEDGEWEITSGDVLDVDYLKSLGQFDVVYSWGVLHHTGKMWTALENVVPLVSPNGKLYISIYNDQRWISNYWMVVKRFYNRSFIGRWIVVGTHSPFFLLRNAIRWFLTRSKTQRRGMDPWRDIIDWLGGYPFEVARPEEIVCFFRERNFQMEKMTTVQGKLGCNQFVFSKSASTKI